MDVRARIHGRWSNGDDRRCNLEMVSWLLGHRIGYDAHDAFDSAILNQCLDTAKVLEAHSDLMDGGHCYNDALLNVAGSGELESAKWLFNQFSDDPDVDLFAPVHVFTGEPSTVLDAAAYNGNLAMVQYFHQLDLDIKALKDKQRTVGKAQRKGGTWSGRGITCTADAMDFAASAGNLEIVQYLHHNRSEGCTVDAMDSAATEDNLETVQWLHENRTEGCTDEAMDTAAAKGHLDMVKWLHENHNGTQRKMAISMLSSG